MTDTPNPLTADEIAAVFDAGMGWCGEATFARIQATIEQQREQIERLRTALSGILIRSLDPTIQNEAFSALAATESKP